MKPDTREEPPSDKNTMFCFWDTETRQDQLIDEKNPNLGTKHIVNLLVAQTQCSVCKEDENLTKYCVNCGIRQHVFIADPVKAFLDFLALPRKKIKKIICLAHNSRHFDSCFILNYVLHVMCIKPIVIMRGAQILSMEIGHVKFIDSLNFNGTAF